MKTILTEAVLQKIKECDEACQIRDILQTIQQYAEEGTESGAFTSQELFGDLETALWVAYANNNLDVYENYIDSTMWLKRVENKAGGCGVWYYRYTTALIYLGRLHEALEYAEKGVREEPDYPWGWLNLSALRSHFGNRAGALEAIERGLQLVPENREFLQRKAEIVARKTLAEMENHFIDEEMDRRLMEADPEDEAFADKRMAIAGILSDEENFNRIMAVIRPENWIPDSPYCYFHIPYKERRLEVCLRMSRAMASKLDPVWLKTLLDSLAEMDRLGREWICEMKQASLKNWELSLLNVLIDRNSSVILNFGVVGKETENGMEVTFQKELRIDETLQDNYSPEIYTEEELDAIEDHIEAYFGAYDAVMHELVSPDIHVDICIIEPTPERNYYTLVTCGAGAHVMNVPEGVDAALWGRLELFICLPPDWDIRSSDEQWYWPIRCLKTLARMPLNGNSWLCILHTVNYGAPLAENCPFTGIILLGPQNAEPQSGFCQFPDGSGVNFYQLFPLLPGELLYKAENGGEAMLEDMAEVDHVVDLHRPDTYSDYRKPLPGWAGPDGCFATDRIMKDGCKVGYFYRELPEEGFPDSGWRFTAGDETREYLDDEERFGFYQLKVVCQYDPDLVPLLTGPVGTAYFRDEAGDFRKETHRLSTKIH